MVTAANGCGCCPVSGRKLLVLSPLVKDEGGEVGIKAMIRLPVTNVVRSTQLADNALGI